MPYFLLSMKLHWAAPYPSNICLSTAIYTKLPGFTRLCMTLEDQLSVLMKVEVIREVTLQRVLRMVLRWHVQATRLVRLEVTGRREADLVCVHVIWVE